MESRISGTSIVIVAEASCGSALSAVALTVLTMSWPLTSALMSGGIATNTVIVAFCPAGWPVPAEPVVVKSTVKLVPSTATEVVPPPSTETGGLTEGSNSSGAGRASFSSAPTQVSTRLLLQVNSIV